MESHATQSALYNFIGWADKNRKQLIIAVAALALIVIVVLGKSAYSERQEKNASEALSELRPAQISPNSPGTIPSQDYLRLADANIKTSAGERALLLGGGALFAEGKYPEALSQFEKFLVEYPDSPLRPEATIGAAASLDAQGKIVEATARYKEVSDRFGGSPSAIQSKFALARLYEAQGKPELALKFYEDVQKEDPSGSVGGYYAKLCVANLMVKSPALKLQGASSPAIP